MRSNLLAPKPLERAKPRKTKTTLHELEYEELERLDDLLEAEENLLMLHRAKEPNPLDLEDAQLTLEKAREALTENAEQMENKLENYAKYIQNLRQLKNSIEYQITHFQRRKHSIVETLNWLKGTLMHYLNTRGIKIANAGALKIAKQRSAPTVLIEIPVEDLPPEFQRITVEAEKNELREALTRGDVVNGVRIIQKEHIRIRTQ